MKKITLLAILITLYSCFFFKENGIEVKIKNRSQSTIEDVKFYTMERFEIVEFGYLNPNESASAFLSMEKNQSDGNYILEYISSKGVKEIIPQGYYTNGGSLDNWVEYEILPDTVLVKFSGTRY